MLKKVLMLISALVIISVLISCAKDSDDEEITSCEVTTFTKDNTVQSLCSLTEHGNHVVIKGLSIPAGESFIIYAGTDSAGSGGGVFTFDGDSGNLSAMYKGSAATGSTVSVGSNQYWLIGFHEESPSVHIVVKSSNDANLDPENYSSVIDIEPDGWTAGDPVSESFYYKASSGVTVSSVKLFHEGHSHEHK